METTMAMDQKTYTLDEVKKAFWEQFHCAGEVWFNYLGTNEENEGSTKYRWEMFLENLDSVKGNKDGVKG